MSYILEIDGNVLSETDYTVDGEDIKVNRGLLGGEKLILYTLDDEQLLTKYELYCVRKTAPNSSLLWETRESIDVDPAQGRMLQGNLPKFQGV